MTLVVGTRLGPCEIRLRRRRSDLVAPAVLGAGGGPAAGGGEVM